MKRFEKRTVVITGASRGIGKGIAKRFADEGANLVLAANEPSVDAVAQEYTADGLVDTLVEWFAQPMAHG